MGYYSELLMDRDDGSYPEPQTQLLWRLEDLESRREELLSQELRYDDGVCWTADDLRYVLPGAFTRASDVEAAIRVAREDLRSKYGVEDAPEENAELDEHTCMQISLMEFLALQPERQIAA